MLRAFLRLLLVPLAGFALWFGLTSFATGGAIANWAPCPRNWAWTPAWLPRASPLESLALRLGHGRHVKLCYGSPALRGRTMIGGDAVPYGKLWRTGANEPTTLHVDGPIDFGPLSLSTGSYSIYTIPGRSRWTVIVNASTSQWGLESEYAAVASDEVGRFEAAVEPLGVPEERLLFRAFGTGVDGSDLLLEWQTTRLRIPVARWSDEPE